MLNQNTIYQLLKNVTGAESVYQLAVVQHLWSGYGYIVRYGLTGCDRASVIVKHVQVSGKNLPNALEHSLSHQRKVRSYQIETAWYAYWSQYCHHDCRVPECIAYQSFADDTLIILEDLDAAGFPKRRSAITLAEMQVCLKWLAHFHATFMGKQPEQLWPIGTYWHLATRSEELNTLQDRILKNAASAIDAKLSASPYQTLVHGDAKLANFCFSFDGRQVAAVDFQYVGGGCGMKDVAYFIDSCVSEHQLDLLTPVLLDFYFQALKQALLSQQKSVNFAALEQDWRALYPVAWTDFHRFLKGWSPGHWSSNSYSERIARQVIAQL